MAEAHWRAFEYRVTPRGRVWYEEVMLDVDETTNIVPPRDCGAFEMIDLIDQHTAEWCSGEYMETSLECQQHFMRLDGHPAMEMRQQAENFLTDLPRLISWGLNKWLLIERRAVAE